MDELTFCIVVTAIAFLIGFYNLLIAILGLFPSFRDTAVGTLHKRRTERNVPIRHGRKIPIVTNYTYQYTVNGKKYRYSSLGYFTKGHLYKKVTMVYVKGFPRYAYPQKFTATTQWSLGLCMLFMGLMFTFVILFA